MLRESITWRLTLLFSVLSSTVLASVAIIASIALERHFAEEDLAEIQGKLELVQHALENTHSSNDLKSLSQHLNDALVGHHMLMVAVYSAENTLVYSSPASVFPEELLASLGNERQDLIKWDEGAHSYRGLTVLMPIGMNNMPPMKVAIAVNIEHHERFISEVHQSLLIALLIGILLMILVGWIAAKRGLAPVRELDQLAKSVSASQLHDRLNLESLPVELKELAQSFNAMLARLEDSFARLSDFSSDLAHELRTPISNLMTQNHVVLSKPRTIEEYREILYSNLEEYDHISHMISDMLFLAKADNGLIVPNKETMNLGIEADAVIEFYEPLTDEKAIKIIRRGNADFMGDRLMIRRAISNLLSNAIKYTAMEEKINLEIELLSAKKIRVCIDNPGDAIASDHLSRIFDRFYRIDPSRQRDTEGAGLGLAITKSIIEAHGGSISAVARVGLMRFEIMLPVTD